MKQTLIILAMSSIVAYGQERKEDWRYDSATVERIRKVKLLYNSPIEFSHDSPKYKKYLVKDPEGLGIISISYKQDGLMDIRLIDSNNKTFTKHYKLIETK